MEVNKTIAIRVTTKGDHSIELRAYACKSTPRAAQRAKLIDGREQDPKREGFWAAKPHRTKTVLEVGQK